MKVRCASFPPTSLVVAAAIFSICGCKKREDNQIQGSSARSETAQVPPAAELQVDDPRKNPATSNRAELIEELAAFSQESEQSLQTTGRLKEFSKEFGQVRFEDILHVLQEAGFTEESGAIRMALAEFLRSKSQLDSHRTKQFLLERNDPELTMLSIGSLAAETPRDALEVVAKTAGPLKQSCLLTLFGSTMVAKPDQALPLIRELRDPAERDIAASVFVTELPQETLQLMPLKRLLNDNLELFSGKSRGDLFVSLGAHLSDFSLPELTRQFDPGVEWQRRVMVGYLNARGQNSPDEVIAYLKTSAAQKYTTGEIEELQKGLPANE